MLLIFIHSILQDIFCSFNSYIVSLSVRTKQVTETEKKKVTHVCDFYHLWCNRGFANCITRLLCSDRIKKKLHSQPRLNTAQRAIWECLLNGFIIHSKYFPDSDWLKAHAQFTITTYWWPHLEEFCDLSTNDVKSAAQLQVNAPLAEKSWGWGWVVLVVKTKMADISLISRVRSRRNNS